MTDEPHAAFADGQTVGSYLILRRLGQGGMATVYLARDLRHSRSVALKVLHPNLAHALGSKRFQREIEVAANLTHPHILPLHDSGEVAGQLYYVMPYIEGESLRDRLKRETQLSVDDALQITRQVAGALAYAHGHGVVHRDIKPENVLLSAGHALVADFGIARAIDAADEGHLTATGIAVGTPPYMSPEQASGDGRIDGRTDVYSLGCVVYEMLAGEPPYTGPTAQAIIVKRLTDPVPSVRRLRPAVGERLDDAIMRALALVPADRYGSATEFAQELTLEPRGTESRQVPVPRARHAARTRQLAAAGGVLALVGLAALGIGLRPRRAAPQKLDPNVVVVAPFRVANADPSLGYLREGMVDLLGAKLTGEGGPRAADSRSVLSAWRTAHGADRDGLPEDAAIGLAEQLGAGQLLLGNVVGVPGRLVLNVSLRVVPSGKALATTSVEGPVDSLPALVDRLTARLLTLGAGEAEQRVASLTSTSLPALKEYLEGQALFRRGLYADATTHYGRALDFDSTFALAALGLLAGGTNTGSPEALSRGQSLVWLARDRLTPRDNAYMMALIGLASSDTISYSRMLSLAEHFVSVAPDRVEAWTEMADDLFNFGDLLGVPAAPERAAAAYRRAVDLDPSYAPARVGVVLGAARVGDTRTVRRYGGPDLTDASAEAKPLYVRWRTAVALGDGARLETLRAGFDTTSIEWLASIGQLGQYEGVAVGDAESAIADALRRESRSEYRMFMLAEAATLAFNQGRPAKGLGFRQEQRTMLGERATRPYIEQVLDALYWDGDSAAGATAARNLQALTATLSPDSLSRHANTCVLEQWRLAHNQLGTARRSITDMRKAKLSRSDSPGSLAMIQGCATLLDAILAAAEKRKDADVQLERLDSLMLTGPPYRNADQSWNLVIARLKEARGDRQGALAATRRRIFLYGEPLFLSTYLREEGRLAASTGERPEAIRAYQHYLALRADPELAVRPEVEKVRAELGRLTPAVGTPSSPR